MASEPPKFSVSTAYCQQKPRFRTVTGPALERMINTAKNQLNAIPRFSSKGVWKESWLTVSNGVLEVYQQGNDRVGYLFVNLDVWLSYPNRYTAD